MSQIYRSMSYTHGPHIESNNVYYCGDNRTATYKSKTIRVAPPAWLVADWMLARHNGQPISKYEEKMCEMCTDNNAILWLRDYLR